MVYISVSLVGFEIGQRVNRRKFLELNMDLNGEENVDISHWVFLCQTEEHSVLIDSGPYDGKLLKKNGRGEYKFYNDIITLLSEYVLPSKIDFIILTHLHWDHCANCNLFPNARVIVQRDEIKYTLNHIPIHNRFYDVDSLRFLDSHRNVELIDGNVEISEFINVVKSPGHTPGSQSIVVKHNKARIAFQGDNYTLGTGNPPGISSSILDWWNSSEKIKHLSDVTIPTHDPSAGILLKRATD